MIESTLVPRGQSEAIDVRFNRVVPYLKARGSAIFISHSRFWERHSFTQQSLAKHLTQIGLEVTWFDGFGWRYYKPFLYFHSPLLKVKQLSQIPGLRFAPIKALSRSLQVSLIKKRIKQKGKPLIWVQEGIPEDIAERLPYIDIYSVFDNPYLHQPPSALCEKAKIIVCQNSFSYRIFSKNYGKKVCLGLPPLDLDPAIFADVKPVGIPAGFPTQIMGSVGSLVSTDFDLEIFEGVMKRLPHWGFLLAGRIDLDGKQYLKRFSQHPNFLYIPWMPRSQVASVWKRLSLTLLFYRGLPYQHGAFPVRSLESMHFGVPCLATRVPKTDDLEGFFQRGADADELSALVEGAVAMPYPVLQKHYQHFVYEMNPKLHIARIVESLE